MRETVVGVTQPCANLYSIDVHCSVCQYLITDIFRTSVNGIRKLSSASRFSFLVFASASLSLDGPSYQNFAILYDGFGLSIPPCLLISARTRTIPSLHTLLSFTSSWKDSTELDPATRTNEVREFRRAADRCGYWIEERSGIPLTAANLQSNNVSVDPSREHRLDQAAHELEFTLRLKDVGAERGSDGRPMGRWLREDHCYSRTVIASYDSGSDGS
ncbi:hypothetical protein MPH_11850 [Macrophomina phaseolina MS6]|uniref:Uncharacterized protein n=1 Tax=Macrophomina phaseolina (strain MS6) TaxID=1126212 RepID=K2RDY5_MACPH|nr:hypothetical protein MPH_11850 [Macrophomina phaseolina MS6]